MGANLGGHLQALPSHTQRHPAIKPQLDGTFQVHCAWSGLLFSVHGKEKVYGSIP